LKKHRKSSLRSESTLKRTKARGPVQRDAKEVMAEVLGKLTERLDAPADSFCLSVRCSPTISFTPYFTIVVTTGANGLPGAG
jgi:hypothetical protein